MADDRAQLCDGLTDPKNTAAGVWANTAYRLSANERYLADVGNKSRSHRPKPLPRLQARPNGKTSARRVRVEYPFP